MRAGEDVDGSAGVVGRDVNAKEGDEGIVTTSIREFFGPPLWAEIFLPLHAAATENSAQVALLLIKHGAKVNAKDHLGNTPLIMATKNSSTDVAKLLVEHGANTKGIDLRSME